MNTSLYARRPHPKRPTVPQPAAARPHPNTDASYCTFALLIPLFVAVLALDVEIRGSRDESSLWNN